MKEVEKTEKGYKLSVVIEAESLLQLEKNLFSLGKSLSNERRIEHLEKEEEIVLFTNEKKWKGVYDGENDLHYKVSLSWIKKMMNEHTEVTDIISYIDKKNGDPYFYEKAKEQGQIIEEYKF